MTARDQNLRFASQLGVPTNVFSDPTITVELRSEAANAPGNRSAFILALNLLSRVFERVHAVFPAGAEAPDHPWDVATIKSVVDQLDETVEGVVEIGVPAHTDVVLSIGERSSVPATRDVVVRGSPWRAALDKDLPRAGEGVLGSLYAACLGAAQVLLHVLDLARSGYHPMAPYTFSLLDLLPNGEEGEAPSAIVIPETHLVGVGAVGSAAIYTLAHFRDLGGTIHLIDNEQVDASNLHRYVLMRRHDIGRWKADVAIKALAQCAIQTRPYRDAFLSYASEHGTNIDLLLSPVDTTEGRRALSRFLPRRIINAATGGATVTISTHGFNDGNACLHCLYPEKTNTKSREEIIADHVGIPFEKILDLVQTNSPVDAQLVEQIERNRGVARGRWTKHIGLPIDSFFERAVCGDAELRLPTGNTIAPLSFISASAGVLLAVELIKSASPKFSRWALNNYFRIDTLFAPNPAFRALRRQDTSGICICNDPHYVDTYSRKYLVK